MTEKIIGIGGGVGPMAGVDLHKKIIENTLSGGTDHGHLEVIHISRSSDITNSNIYLGNDSFENPAEGMFRIIVSLHSAITTLNKKMVFGVPCNTFHSPKIFDHFLALSSGYSDDIEILHMIYETGKHIQSVFPSIKNVGLMSTIGTRKTAVYDEILGSMGFNVIYVEEVNQNKIDSAISNQERGIKATTPVTKKAKDNLEESCKELKSLGSEIIILGCTEIPLALRQKKIYDIDLIDPTTILARALVKVANQEKLVEL